MLAGYLFYEFKNYPQERQVSRFFEALELQDFQGAYRIWQPTSAYTFKDFLQDWGRQGLQAHLHLLGGNGQDAAGIVINVAMVARAGIAIKVILDHHGTRRFPGSP